MPGAAGRKLGNYMYKAARPDGLTIGLAGATLLYHGVLGEAGVLYDIDKFIYLGNNYSGMPFVFHTRKEAGLDSLSKLRAASGVRIGASSVGAVIYVWGRLSAYLIGMREAKFVVGYSASELDLAVERGEADARASVPDAIIHRSPDWIDKALMDFHIINPVRKGRRHSHPLFARLPDLENFAKSERERQLLALERAFRLAGQPIFLPPGTPKEQVQIMREAMRKTFRDPDYYKEYQKLAGVEAEPLMPEEIEEVIRDLPRDPEIIDLFKKIAGSEALPPR
jgi:tripartite-type tricarboxylate transporter receptor subunit TctC